MRLLPSPRLLLGLAGLGAALGPPAAAAHADAAVRAPYVPGEVIVRYAHATPAVAQATSERKAGAVGVARAATAHAPFRVLALRRGTSVEAAVHRLRRAPGVLSATPNYRVHAAGSIAPFWPRDPGRSRRLGAWTQLQWNFLATAGVDAPAAWSNVAAAGHPGGSGVRVAVLDTGIAYRNWHAFRRSPDFASTRFAAPWDVIAHNRFPLDRNGHGTHVAGTIAEQTNNGVGVTGLAYGATVVPVRVLDADGGGDAATVAAGIRYAVRQRVKVINLSLEFDGTVTPASIPDVIDAIESAHRHGILVVAAAGNDRGSVVYPARATHVLSVGATTYHSCLSNYSNRGAGLDLVAPGGGDDAPISGDPHCQPEFLGRPIYQETLLSRVVRLVVRSHGRRHAIYVDRPYPNRFGLPSDYDGTSMAAPHVSATAALVIASGVLGPDPTPEALTARLEQTARDLGAPGPDRYYGFGLLNAARATAP